MSFVDRILGRKRPPAGRKTSHPPSSPRVYPGVQPLEVRGESYRQDALARVVGGKTQDGHATPVVAVLRPEPTNPYDTNAIAVLINGTKVGYVNKDDAAQLHRSVADLEIRTGRPVALNGTIVGGWDHGNGDEGHFGVWLEYDPQDF